MLLIATSLRRIVDILINEMLGGYSSPDAVTAFLERAGFRVLREGSRYRDFVNQLLAGYSLELGVLRGTGIREISSFSADFEIAKEKCILPLFSMGYISVAFALSKQYLCFLGLLMSFEKCDGDEVIIRDFISLVRDNFDVCCVINEGDRGERSITLGSYTLERLFTQKRFAQMIYITQQLPEIFQRGGMCEYASMEWILSLSKLQWVNTAKQSSSFAATLANPAAASVIVSVSKLCSEIGDPSQVEKAECENRYLCIVALKQMAQLEPSSGSYSFADFSCSSEILNAILRTLRSASDAFESFESKRNIIENLIVSCTKIMRCIPFYGNVSAEELEKSLLELIDISIRMEMEFWEEATISTCTLEEFLKSDRCALDKTLLASALRNGVVDHYSLRPVDLPQKIIGGLSQSFSPQSKDLILGYISAFLDETRTIT